MCWNCLVNQSDELSIPNSGDPFVRLIYGASGPQVHGSAARPTHNPQLFWWRGRQFRSQWQRRYMVLCIPLPFWSTHIAYSAWGIASSDGNVYIWDRDRAILLNVLTGHGSGSVNSVAWNPQSTQMFASCSDDFTIRLWGPSGSGSDAESSSGLVHQMADEQSQKREPSEKGEDSEQSR